MTSDKFDLKAAPMRIATVRLKVRDLDRVSGFYERILGLERLAAPDNGKVLGTKTTPLLELVGDPALAPNERGAAGLFHTAFLMPGRADLARWLGSVAESDVPLHGASDHIVSEAIYLADPEGNGIEVYADRPVSRWRAPNGEIHMTTDPLDVQDLLAAAGGTAWSGFPEAGTIGHVHLQVGDTAAAEQFYHGILGFDVATRYPGASFFGSGGYHHQLAGNVWNSRGAGRRPERMAGLDRVELIVRDADERTRILDRARQAGLAVSDEQEAPTLRDPWGNAITLAN